MHDDNFKPIPLQRRSDPDQEAYIFSKLSGAVGYVPQDPEKQTAPPAPPPARPLTNADDALAIVRKITAPDVPDSRKYEAIRLVATFDRQAPVSKAQMWRVIRWLLDRCPRPGAGPQLYDAIRSAQER
nr:hypothetical protein [uncultured Dysosmobacter sp.]